MDDRISLLAVRLIGIKTSTFAKWCCRTAGSASPRLRDRMAVAHLKEAGRMDEAVRLVLAAFRAALQDAALHRGFRKPPRHPTHRRSGSPGLVTDETCVRLTTDDDVRYAIYKDPPIDRRRK